MTNKVKIAGYIILICSCIIWGLIFIIPFLNYSKGQTAGIITILIIAGEVTFYLSIFLLGKSFYEKFKNKFKFWKTKTKNTELNNPDN